MHRYKDQKFSLTFVVLAVSFCVCLIVANLMEIKTVDLGVLTITAGVVVFPLSYIINDCLVELYGLSRAKVVILLGFAMNLLVVGFLQLGILLPGSAQWHGQAAFELVFGSTARILLASFAAFLAGSLTNAVVMDRMRRANASAGFSRSRFSLRAIASTLAGEGVDSLIFFPIAFGGVLDISTVVMLIMTQTLLKTLYEVVALPLTLLLVSRLRDIENNDNVIYANS